MILQADAVTKSFGGLRATDKVSLQIQEGELSSIIGPNGAGKTTLFNLLTGKLHPDSGKITFQGEDISDLPPYEICRRGMGRSFQRTNIFPQLSAFANVQMAVLSKQKKTRNIFFPVKKIAKKKTDEILESIRLSDRKDVLGGLLAYGDQKLLDIGIALATNPKLLLLDEPTAGMSPAETERTTELIQSLAQTHHLTLVFVEHDMNVVFGISDKITVLHQGRIIFEGEPDEVKANDKVQKIYLGEEKA
ncbi:MAG: ABC transporter ATP-binding protein [Deltaproteobacteria bacterium]|nr:ABC transporter ATP-binding protein [Deltaproteobacteria bacterium]MBW2149102.1 ABC transporter ATP-binding protein [Deltaproteobacteria bacterium]